MADQCQVVKTRSRSYRRVLTWFASRWRNHQPKRAEKPHSKFSVVRRWTALLRGRRLRLPWRIASGSRQPPRGARLMSARERECGGLPSPNLSLLDRKVGQGLIRFGEETSKTHAGLTGSDQIKPDDLSAGRVQKRTCPQFVFGQNLRTNEPNTAQDLWDAFTTTSWRPSDARRSSG